MGTVENLKLLREAEAGLTPREQLSKYHQLIGALSVYVDSKDWARIVSTTYSYIRKAQPESEMEQERRTR